MGSPPQAVECAYIDKKNAAPKGRFIEGRGIINTKNQLKKNGRDVRRGSAPQTKVPKRFNPLASPFGPQNPAPNRSTISNNREQAPDFVPWPDGHSPQEPRNLARHHHSAPKGCPCGAEYDHTHDGFHYSSFPTRGGRLRGRNRHWRRWNGVPPQNRPTRAQPQSCYKKPILDKTPPQLENPQDQPALQPQHGIPWNPIQPQPQPHSQDPPPAYHQTWWTHPHQTISVESQFPPHPESPHFVPHAYYPLYTPPPVVVYQLSPYIESQPQYLPSIPQTLTPGFQSGAWTVVDIPLPPLENWYNVLPNPHPIVVGEDKVPKRPWDIFRQFRSGRRWPPPVEKHPPIAHPHPPDAGDFRCPDCRDTIPPSSLEPEIMPQGTIHPHGIYPPPPFVPQLYPPFNYSIPSQQPPVNFQTQVSQFPTEPPHRFVPTLGPPSEYTHNLSDPLPQLVAKIGGTGEPIGLVSPPPPPVAVSGSEKTSVSYAVIMPPFVSQSQLSEHPKPTSQRPLGVARAPKPHIIPAVPPYIFKSQRPTKPISKRSPAPPPSVVGRKGRRTWDGPVVVMPLFVPEFQLPAQSIPRSRRPQRIPATATGLRKTWTGPPVIMPPLGVQAPPPPLVAGKGLDRAFEEPTATTAVHSEQPKYVTGINWYDEMVDD